MNCLAWLCRLYDTQPVTLVTDFIVCFLEPMGQIRRVLEPAHEIMALFVLRKLILQTHISSHSVGLDVWFLVIYFQSFERKCLVSQCKKYMDGSLGPYTKKKLVSIPAKNLLQEFVYYVHDAFTWWPNFSFLKSSQVWIRLIVVAI